MTSDTIEVRAIEDDDCVDDYPYRKYPAMKVARLATDRRFERREIGRFMLLASVGKVASICESIGCRYITVDSKPPSVGFYKKHGFKLVANLKERDFMPMYLNMYPIVDHSGPLQTELVLEMRQD